MIIQIDKAQIEAQMSALAEQRNVALNRVAELTGELALANSAIKLLTDNGEKLSAEIAELTKVKIQE